MKKEEIIELNGKEYTITMNRESYLKIDQYVNLNKTYRGINESLYEYIDEISDDDDPFANPIDEEKMEEEINKKENLSKRMFVRGFYILLYPKHQLKINQVEKLLKPYFDDENKLDYISEKYAEYLRKCIEIREKYNEERKNLKAQTSKN